MTEPREPDYEAIMEDRAIERGERQMHRLDAQYGRVEDWRVPYPNTADAAAVATGPSDPGNERGQQ